MLAETQWTRVSRVAMLGAVMLILCTQGCDPKAAGLRADANFRRGSLLMTQGKFEESIAAYRDALADAPRMGACHYNIGLDLDALGRTEEALREFQAEAELNPADVNLQHKIAETLASLGRSDEALATYRLATRLVPNSPEAYRGLANHLSRRQNFAEAITAHRTALRLQPDADDGWWAALAYAMASDGDVVGAARLLRDVAGRTRTNDGSREYYRGFAYRLLGQHHLAIPEFRAALRAAPRKTFCWSFLAESLALRGRYGEALKAYEMAARDGPQNRDAVTGRATCLRHLGRDEDALAAYQRALQEHPDGIEVHTGLSVVMRRLGRSRQATAEYRKTIHICRNNIQAAPRNAMPLYSLARAHALNGYQPDALAALADALRLAPTFKRMAREDPDLASLRGDPTFRQLTAGA